MTISDHYKGTTQERLIVSIVTVDTINGRIEAVGKDAAVVQIGVKPVPVLFRWPKENEYWIVIRQNGLWQLDSLVESPGSISRIENIQPGEALLQSEVLWTPSGQHFVTQAALDARPRISLDEYVASSGSLASGAESGSIVVAHSLNVVPSVVSGHLENGSWAHHVGWRVSGRTTSQISFVFRNNGPNTATAILRFRLIY